MSQLPPLQNEDHSIYLPEIKVKQNNIHTVLSQSLPHSKHSKDIGTYLIFVNLVFSHRGSRPGEYYVLGVQVPELLDS